MSTPSTTPSMHAFFIAQTKIKTKTETKTDTETGRISYNPWEDRHYKHIGNGRIVQWCTACDHAETKCVCEMCPQCECFERLYDYKAFIVVGGNYKSTLMCRGCWAGTKPRKCSCGEIFIPKETNTHRVCADCYDAGR